MTKISIGEDLNISKTHFETLEEFKEYVENHIIHKKIDNLVNEESADYQGMSDEMAFSEQLNIIIEQLKQVKDIRLMEKIGDMIQDSLNIEPPIY